MKHRFLGPTGLKVSELCLGTMTFGWGVDESLGHQMLSMFVELGGNFVDTADIYADGMSERIIGRWLKDRSRDSLVIATKVRFATGRGPNEVGLSRKHILTAVVRQTLSEYPHL